MYLTQLPKSLERLNEFTHDLWWSWNQESFDLFRKINPETWDKTRNPLKTIASASSSELEKLSTDSEFMGQFETLENKRKNYLDKKDCWFQKNFPAHQDKKMVYFSAEYGLHESLPIYSGGLGILSGDHVKSASDLGLPLSFVGLFYQNGYFLQHIDKEGKQVDLYQDHNPELLPITPATHPNHPDKQIRFDLDFPGRKVAVRLWKAKVGRVDLFLLDSNDPANGPEDRAITARLYGGDREMRISQEIILGIGGVKALKELGLTPDVYHMNEGHSGFFQIERIRQTMVEENLSFEEAKVKCSSNCVFTTHTPVPAGNETFSLPLMHKYFYERAKELKISWRRFLELGLIAEKEDYKYFSLTVFALNVSRFYNGVSELHGKIAKKMWKNQWRNIPEFMNPISHITNGVHVQTWMNKHTKNLLSQYVAPDWEENQEKKELWKKVLEIPTAEIQSTQETMKKEMIDLVRKHLREQLTRHERPQIEIEQTLNALNPNTLTIGFARRFATYKRATLIFKDLERLEKLVNHPERPVQFIFAGKAHPADIPGQKYIEEIYQISRRPEFRGKVVILENYDMNISSKMVAGVDVWLNTPRRPMEASGTSGQKVPLNFGLNFSVLDGWWREGHNGENGWKIGEEKDYPSEDIQDFEDANDFYNTLEETIIPLYYQETSSNLQRNGLSEKWIEKCKESLLSNLSLFSTQRMVQDYTKKLYTPALEYGETFNEQSGRKKIESYITERRFLRLNWDKMAIQSFEQGGQFVEVPSKYHEYAKTPSHHVDFPLDQTMPGRIFEALHLKPKLELYLGDLTPEQVIVEMVGVDKNVKEGDALIYELKSQGLNEMGLASFTGEVKSNTSKAMHWRLRIRPRFSQGLSHPFEFGLCTWA